MSRLTHELRALFCVAAVAHIRLSLERQHGVVFDVQVMAVNTGSLLNVMHAAHPVKTGAAVVAGQAGVIFKLRRDFRSKRNGRTGASTALGFFGMSFTGTVTGLAAVISFRHR